jgi:hypothetical protein
MVSPLIESLHLAGFTEAQAGVLIDVFTGIVQTQRTFGYSTPFPAVDADCTLEFTRSFTHQDWIDGESVCQAEESTAEEGFNRRFHNIEDDIDALASEIGKAFLCLAETRASLRALLDEIQAEINRINGDIFRLRQPTTPTPPPFHALPHDIVTPDHVILDPHDVIITEPHHPPPDLHLTPDVHLAPEVHVVHEGPAIHDVTLHGLHEVEPPLRLVPLESMTALTPAMVSRLRANQVTDVNALVATPSTRLAEVLDITLDAAGVLARVARDLLRT